MNATVHVFSSFLPALFVAVLCLLVGRNLFPAFVLGVATLLYVSLPQRKVWQGLIWLATCLLCGAWAAVGVQEVGS